MVGSREDLSGIIDPTPTDAVCPRSIYGDEAKPPDFSTPDGFAV